VNDNGMSGVLGETQWNFAYTGNYRTFVAPQDGTYKLEAWGAGGGYATRDIQYRRPNGAYCSGTISLKGGQTIYVYVGEYGGSGRVKGGAYTTLPAKWNGGGAGGIVTGADNHLVSGGGATDFRLAGGEWNNAMSLNSRILVAGGSAGNVG
jgi:hypothetical protein